MKYITPQQRQFALALATVVVDRVDELAAMKGMSYREVGEFCGITNRSYAGSWWSRIRRRVLKEKNPSIMLYQIARLAARLGVDPAELTLPFKDSPEEKVIQAADRFLTDAGVDTSTRKPRKHRRART
jgi:transcriptional regulator with XRE-family HTH domain